MKQIRRKEFENATASLGIKTEILDWGDLKLSEKPFTELLVELLKIVRRLDPAVVFSFDPFEMTRDFDHPDHELAGQLARRIGATSDVEHYCPEQPAMEIRPELFLWTTKRQRADYQVKVSQKSMARRDAYAVKHYPSQFSAETQPEWRKIFDRINGVKRNGKKKKSGREYWIRVR